MINPSIKLRRINIGVGLDFIIIIVDCRRLFPASKHIYLLRVGIMAMITKSTDFSSIHLTGKSLSPLLPPV